MPRSISSGDKRVDGLLDEVWAAVGSGGSTTTIIQQVPAASAAPFQLEVKETGGSSVWADGLEFGAEFSVAESGNLALIHFDVLTTKGDLLVYSTALTRLGVGADATALVADSGQAAGVKWAAIVNSLAVPAALLTVNAATGAVVISIATPIQTYTPTNVTTDRSYDANATTVDELADVLGTLIADLQAKGLIQ